MAGYPAKSVSGTTLVPIPISPKDHTERILKYFSSVVDPDPVGSASFGRNRIRIVMEKTDPGSIKNSQNKGGKIFVFYNFLLDLYYTIITSKKKTEI